MTCGPGPHRVGRPRLTPSHARFVDADDDMGGTTPLIDPLDDREGRD